jgi:LysM repeat protein
MAARVAVTAPRHATVEATPTSRAAAEAALAAGVAPAVNAAATATAVAVQTARAQAAFVAQFTRAPLPPTYLLYTVQPGDTVASIARRFHDVTWLIRRRNGGLWTMAPGQVIRVWQWPFGRPYEVTRTALTDHPLFYTVASGDTLGAIAARLHTDVATLAAQNGVANAGLIFAGQQLVLHRYTVHRQRMLVPGVPADRLHTGLLMTDIADLVGADAALVKAIGWHESAWRMVRGRSGEIGIMQLMPYMAAWVQRALVGYPLDPNVAVDNILEGTLLIRYYLDVTHDDTHRALALYHSGDTTADKRNGLYIRATWSLRDYFYHYPRAGW